MSRRNKKHSNGKTTGNTGNNASTPSTTANARKAEATGSKSEESANVANSAETPSEENKSKAKNDVAWYDVIPGLLSSSANVPYSYPQGDIYNPNVGSGLATGSGWYIKQTGASRVSFGGVCSLRVKSSFGRSFTRNDPANVCATAAYTHVRFMNSGRKNYDPADLFMYYGAIAEINAFIEWCKRLYNYAFTYSQRNKFIGKALIEANFVDPDAIMMNMANFRYWLNSFISKVASYAIPSDVAIFKRKAFMFASYYIENGYNNIKDQLYQFIPDGFYGFQLDNDGAGMLKFHTIDEFFNDGKLTMSSFKDIADMFLQNIFGDEDFGLMSGDVLKAYQGNIIVPSICPEEAGIAPVFDPYVLSQFKNATIVGALVRGSDAEADTLTYKSKYKSGNVYQDVRGNVISFDALQPNTAGGVFQVAAGLNMAKIISVESPEPGPGDTIEATRLTLSGDSVSSVMDDWNEDRSLVVSGDYIVTREYLSRYKLNNGDAAATVETVTFVSTVYPFVDFASTNGLKNLSLITQFKYCPLLVTANTYDETPTSVMWDDARIQGNVDNFTFLTLDNIRTMHECALLSMYYVPGVAKLIS